MPETAETQILTRSSLDAIHQRLGATMIGRDGWSVPGSYGDVLFEYASVREGGAGLIDLSPRGRILVSGSEAVQFLNGLITNDMKTLAEGSWMPAAFPNVQGRLIASVRVIRLKDDQTGQTTPAGLPRRGPRPNVGPTFLIDTEAATHERVLKTIERFTLAGDFLVSDVTNQTAHITVQGKKAAHVVRAVFGMEPTDLSSTEAKQIASLRNEVTGDSTVVRATHTGEDGFDLILNAGEASSLWDVLHSAGAR
ncbi:MAG: hypothetical protein M3R52_05860, partial [Acidobacteriota bacterium]|nr:hypothetical protein [Acidobacteriota bacterium]